jgi:hypothetical protein
MTLDRNIEIVATAVQAALIGVLVFRGILKKLPLFSSYVIWLFVIPGAIAIVSKHLSSQHSYEHIFLAASIFDTCFMLCVLVELSMSVLSPIRSALSRWTIPGIAMLLALVLAVIWPFTKPRGYGDLVSVSQYIVHFDIATSVLRIIFFLGLAACSQLLSLGWRDRELQVATGLGFYSFVTLSVSLLQMNLGTASSTMDRYHFLNQMNVGGYLLCAVYWVVSFAQKVPERREFTPQMENFLLALAGTASSTRLSMGDRNSPKRKSKKDEQDRA